MLFLGKVMVDLGRLIGLVFCSRTKLAEENLFQRKQVALSQEHNAAPPKVTCRLPSTLSHEER